MFADATVSATLSPPDRWSKEPVYRLVISANGGRSRLAVDPSLLVIRPVKGDAYEVRTRLRFEGAGRARARLNRRAGVWGVVPPAAAEALAVFGAEVTERSAAEGDAAGPAWSRGEFTWRGGKIHRQVHGLVSGGYGIPLLWIESSDGEEKPAPFLTHIKTGLAVSSQVRGVAAAKRLAAKLRQVAPDLEHNLVADTPPDQRQAARMLAEPS